MKSWKQFSFFPQITVQNCEALTENSERKKKEELRNLNGSF